MIWKALSHSLKCRALERLWLDSCIGCANEVGETSCSLLILGICVVYLVHCALAVVVAAAAWNAHMLKILLVLALVLVLVLV